MDSQAQASRPLLRSAVLGAEAVAALPAVPTPDWCDRAARAVLLPDRTSAAVVVMARLGAGAADGVQRVESVGAAAATRAEVATTVGRHQAEHGAVPLDIVHPALTQLRVSIGPGRQFGWSPGALLSSPRSAATAGEIAPSAGETPLAARWAAGAGVGAGLGSGAAQRLVLGAHWIGAPELGRAVLVELALGPASAETGGTDLEDAARVLDAVLPSLARRAAMAIDPSQPMEDQVLTVREEVVLRRLLEGKSVRLIAEELGRSPHTIHDHVKSLHRKLNASTRGALVARALGHLRPGQTPEPDSGARPAVSASGAARAG